MFSIGADPEFFILDNLNQKIKNAEFYIKGTKEFPFGLKNEIFCLLDGVTVEINPKPAESKQEFVDNILEAKYLVDLLLPEDFNLLEITTAVLDESELTENSRVVGCDPDYNVYTGDVNPKPVIQNYFFAGGHIHIGKQMTDFEKYDIIENLDKHLLPYVNLLEKQYQNKFEKGIRKKVQYGKKGNYRNKSYGLEYRSVSNKWCTNDVTIETTYEIVNDVITTLSKKSILTF
jgi:hypothetical protein